MKRTKLLRRAAYGLYGYILLMFLLVLFFNKPGTFAFSVSMQVCCFVIATGLVFLLFYYLRNKVHTWSLNRNDTLIIVCTLGGLFVLQLLFVSQFYNRTGFDADYIYRAAQNLPHPDFGPTYFSIYPNNLLLLFFERFIYKLTMALGGGVEFYWVLVVVNVMAIDISLYLMYDIAKKIFDKEIALYTFIIGVVLLGFMPWLTSVYSDTLSLPLGLLIFYLYLKLKDEPKTGYRLICGLLIGVLVQVGLLLKPSTIFVAIAIGLIELLSCNYKSFLRQTKRIFLVGGCLIAIMVGVYITKTSFNYVLAHQQLVEYDESMNFPFTHWVMMGMQQSEYKGHASYGFWSGADFALTYNTSGKYAKIRAHLGVIKKRLQAFGLFGYLKFLWEKSIWILGDGTFFWGDEGVRAPVTNEPGLAQYVQAVVYPSGAYYKYYAYLLQTTWLLILFALSATLFAVKKYLHKEFFIISCTIFGSILFVLLFEGRSRYIMNNLGFFVIGAGVGVKQIINIICGIRVRSKKKQERPTVINK